MNTMNNESAKVSARRNFALKCYTLDRGGPCREVAISRGSTVVACYFSFSAIPYVPGFK